MVTVNFKLTEAAPVKLQLSQPELLGSVLKKCAQSAGLQLGGVIAVRNGTVVTHNDYIKKGDVIDVFPALSGG